MGALFSLLVAKKETRIIMLGLDNAGKTAILYKLKLGEQVTTIPTIGFNVETIEYKRLSLNIWDVGGQDRLRPLWKHYYHNSNGLIFVVDCNDVDRIDKAREELDMLIEEDELRDAVFLIYANKQDLPNAIKPQELASKLRLNTLHRPWHVQGSCGKTGDGLYEGLEWLASEISKSK